MDPIDKKKQYYKNKVMFYSEKEVENVTKKTEKK